jgi:hypothetical protein
LAQKTGCRFDARLGDSARPVGQAEEDWAVALDEVVDNKLVAGVGYDDADVVSAGGGLGGGHPVFGKLL